MFICQISLEPEIFGDVQGKIAYIFMTEDEHNPDTFDPNSGENAVIIQPGGLCDVETKSLFTGPTLSGSIEKDGAGSWQAVELSVSLEAGEDPDFIDDETQWEMDEETRDKYVEAVSGSKIGGTPGFLQYAEFPDEGNWNLLLQLDPPADDLFYINFGDAGIGYAFISEDGTKGKFLWQCG